MTETPVYDRSMGEVFYEGEAVVIAGRLRYGIQWATPEVEAAWRWHDQVEATKEERTILAGFETTRTVMEEAR
jgi:hypothetical protein